MLAKRTALLSGGVALVLSAMATAGLALDPPPKPADAAAPAAEVAADGALTTNAGVYSAAQAAVGKTAYDANCSLCHGAALRGSPGGPGLSGGSFIKKWTGRTVGDLYAYMHTNMPPGRAGALPQEQYVAITSYVLEKNGFAPGETDLSLDEAEMKKITIEPVPES